MQPMAFVWRGRTYHVQVQPTWHLFDRWWDPECVANRIYWRVMTKALGVYELYQENRRKWVLDVVQD
jgi:hypothetical protein